MLSSSIPGAQRVIVRQVRRQRPLLKVGGLVGCPSAAEVGAISRRLTIFNVNHQVHLDGSCFARTGTINSITSTSTSTSTSMKSTSGRLHFSSNYSSSPPSGAPMGLGLGALLSAVTAGGLLLVSGELDPPATRYPAVMEASKTPTTPESNSNINNHISNAANENKSDDFSPTEEPPLTPNGVLEYEGDTEEGGGEGPFPPEGRYRFYILSQEEAAIKAARVPKIGQGGAGDGRGGGEGELKGRYSFVIIGEGTAADAAVESLLRMQPEADILYLSDETPSPADDGNTRTGSYESDFRSLKTDLVESFNQWRRHRTFRREDFPHNAGGGSSDSAHRADGEKRRGRREEGRSDYGLARGKKIQYHSYKPHSLVIEPERRCVRLLLNGVEVYYDKCLIANSGKPRDQRATLSRDRCNPRHDGVGSSSSSNSGSGDETKDSTGNDRPDKTRQLIQDAADKEAKKANLGDEFYTREKLPEERINKLMSLQDFVSLELLMDEPSVKHVTVLGGGFVGCEVALALAKRGRDKGVVVAQVYSESGPLHHLLPGYLSEFMMRKLARAGVTQVGGSFLADLRCNLETGRIEGELHGDGTKELDRNTVGTDYVVEASTHFEAKVDVASESGLEIDKGNGGIVVNGLFEAVNGVYAAGSAASFFDPVSGRTRLESHDHCLNSGLLAGYNMAATLKGAENECAVLTGTIDPIDASTSEGTGSSKTKSTSAKVIDKGPPSAPHPRLYDHLPFWRSNLEGCGIILEGVGEIDTRLRTLGVWLSNSEDWDSREAMETSKYQRGIVYYMRHDKVVGVLLVNESDHLERAREVLRSQAKISTIKTTNQVKRLIKFGAAELINVVDTPRVVRPSV